VSELHAERRVAVLHEQILRARADPTDDGTAVGNPQCGDRGEVPDAVGSAGAQDDGRGAGAGAGGRGNPHDGGRDGRCECQSGNLTAEAKH